jgi:hypothetical protein
LATALAAGAILGCGGSGDGATTQHQESEIEGPAATQAAPEVTTPAPETGDLSQGDRAAVAAATRSYVSALDDRDAAAACSLFEPGALELSELPVRRGGCAASLAASLGHRNPEGSPVWKRTDIDELKEVAVNADRARVTATVEHHFADRRYVSIEEDIIYLDRAGDRWLLAQPSGTFYRAVGYPEPPLRSLSPPRG